MTPELAVNVFSQVPSLGVVVWLVIYFLNHLKSTKEQEREFIRDLAEKINAAMHSNAEAITRNTEALVRFEMMTEIRQNRGSMGGQQ